MTLPDLDPTAVFDPYPKTPRGTRAHTGASVSFCRDRGVCLTTVVRGRDGRDHWMSPEQAEHLADWLRDAAGELR